MTVDGGSGRRADRGLLALAVAALALAGIGGAVLVGGLAGPEAGSSRASGSLAAPTTAWWAGPSPVPSSSLDLPSSPSAAPSPAPTPSPTPGFVALPKLSPKVSGATMKYYAVVGRTATGLIEAMHARGPADTDPDSEILAQAAIHWSYAYRYRVSSAGACLVTSATVTARYTVTLPRWTGPSRVRAELLAWWRLVLDVLRDHEARHVRIYGKWMAQLRERLVGARCGAVTSIVGSVKRGMNAENDRLDDREGTMEWPPYDGG